MLRPDDKNRDVAPDALRHAAALCLCDEPPGAFPQAFVVGSRTPGNNRMTEGSDSLPPGAIAVIGMAGRFPGANTPDALWELVRHGREAIRALSDAELRAAGVPDELLANPGYVRAAATLDGMDEFDAGFFGFSPRDAAIMDPQHRHFLECAWEALESAGYTPEGFGGAIGIFGGCGVQAYFARNLLQNRQLMRSAGFFLVRHTGNDKDFLTTRVSYQLNLTGPSVSVQTACSTSLAAIHLASQSLLSRECDMALAGGVTIELPHGVGYLYEEGEILSPDGHCRAFDASSKGTVFGSGAGVVVLRRLEDAVEAGDPIRAIILASALNNDGAEKVGYLAPSVDGQAAVITEALAVAGISPETVTYVEAHGTGTPIGDPIEVAALTKAFGRETQARGFCAIGSVKSNIGHLDTASGVASLVKTVLALEHRELPPTLHYEQPNPSIPFGETPFYVSARLAPWQSHGPRRAGVTSLGVGGTNVHVILQEAPAVQRTPDNGSLQLLVLSARSAAALDRASVRLADHLQARPDQPLADVAWTLQTGRRTFAYRRHVVASDRDDAIAALRGVHAAARPALQDPGVVFLFPGGGAQYPDMGRALYERRPGFRDDVDHVLRVLKTQHAIDLRPLLFPTPDARESARAALEDSTLSILSVFTIEYALGRLWLASGVTPVAMSGHSLGEYAAACLAGVFSLEEALTIVKARGEIFQRLPTGAMLSVALPEADARARLSGDLSLAAVNAPELCVVSGPVDQIERLQAELTGGDIESKRLHIAVAAHSPMLDPFLDEFRQRLRTIALKPPSIPFVSNVSGAWADASEVSSADYWVRHLRQTVRFSDGLDTLLRTPGRLLVEVGPGTALSTLARLHPGARSAGAIVASMPHAQDTTSDDAVFLSAVGTVWTYGQHVAWTTLHDRAQRRVPLPTYPFEHTRYWIDPDADGLRSSAAKSTLSLEKLADLSQWFRTPSWVPLPAAATRPDARNRLVFTARANDNDSLARTLAGHGRCVWVLPGDAYVRSSPDTFTIRPESPDDFTRLLDDLRSLEFTPQDVVYLWLAETTPQAGSNATAAATYAVARGFAPLLLLARASSRADVSPERLVVVTRGAFGLEGDTDRHPEQAIVDGLSRVVATELGIACRIIDALGVPTSIVAAEIISADPTTPVALRSAGRFTEVLTPWESVKRPGVRTIRQGGAYLITGGGGGIATSLTERLARHHGARIALVGRRRPGHFDRLQTIVRALGGEVDFLTADVADAEAISETVAAVVKRFGRLDGVFHTAGVIDDGLIAEKDLASSARVLSPKIEGTLALDRALAGVPLDFLVLFSSTSARLGLQGQADYAAANAFLNAYAQARSADGTRRTIAIGWGVWRDVGMAAKIAGGGLPFAGLTAHGARSPFGIRDDTATDRVRYTALLAPQSYWALDGHRLESGEAVMPGTGFVAWVYHVACDVFGSSRIEMRDVEFLRPLVFPTDEPRTVVCECAANGTFRWFKIWSVARDTSGGSSEIVEHAKGVVTRARVRPRRMGLAELRRRCRQDVPTEAGMVANGQTQHIAFGPQWASVAHQVDGDGETLMTLRLPKAFCGELTTTGLHPALLDVATAAGLHLTGDRSDGLYVPLGYGRIQIYGPLTPEIVSHVRLMNDITAQHMATFDVTISDTRGHVLAELYELTMRRVAPEPLARQAVLGEPGDAQPLAARLTAAGISEDEGFAALSRILASGSGPEVIVSSVSLEALQQQILADATRAVRHGGSGSGAADALHGETERTIARIWEDLLGVPDVGANDDFFDLGGHSLIAVRLANRIEKQLGEKIKLASLLEARTVRQIAAMLGGGSAGEGLSSLVAIRPAGDLPPLFVPHAVGGEVLTFTELARLLDPRQPFYAFRSVGHDGSAPLLRTIEEQASAYCREMLAQHPHGPYYLAGYSHGGRVAYEMAQQLLADGRDVAFLGIIDTWPHEHLPRGLRWAAHALANVPKWLKVDMATTDWQDNVDRLGRATLAMRRRLASMLTMNTRDRDVREDMDISYLPNHVQQTYETNFKAFLAYRPKPYPGHVTLFRAYAQPLNGPHGHDLGWGTLTPSVTVIEIPGSHSSLMAQPDVLDLARALRQALAVARAKQAPCSPSHSQVDTGV